MPAGRPKVDPEDYNTEWQEEMLAGYSDGNSDVWIRVNCFKKHTVSKDLWYRWIEEIDQFSSTVKEGHELCQAWWETKSKEHATGAKPEANATSLIFNMCNRFKNTWQQRQTVEQTTKHTLDINNLEALEELLEEHGVDVGKL